LIYFHDYRRATLSEGQLSFSPSHDTNRNLGRNGFWEGDECMKCKFLYKLPKKTKQKLWKSPFDDEMTACLASTEIFAG